MYETPSEPSLREKLGAALRGRADVRLALLFGSQARGTGRPDSDVDIAVDALGVDTLSLAAELRVVVGRDVQVVELHDAGYALMQALLRDSVVLHQGQAGASGEWTTRMLTLVELDGPLHDRMNRAFLKRLQKRGLGHG